MPKFHSFLIKSSPANFIFKPPLTEWGYTVIIIVFCAHLIIWGIVFWYTNIKYYFNPLFNIHITLFGILLSDFLHNRIVCRKILKMQSRVGHIALQSTIYIRFQRLKLGMLLNEWWTSFRTPNLWLYVQCLWGNPSGKHPKVWGWPKTIIMWYLKDNLIEISEVFETCSIA